MAEAANPLHRYRLNVLEAWAVAIALESGLYERLSTPKTAAQLASELGYDLSALEPLLEVLAVTENLERRGNEQYAIPGSRERYFLRQSPHYIGDTLAFLRTNHLFAHYPEILRKGGAAPLTASDWERITRGSGSHVQPAVAALAKRYPAFERDEMSVLDVGCGRGDYLVALTSLNPKLRAMGIDPTPPVIEEARKRVGGDPRIRVECKQLAEVDEQFDAILVNHVFHVIGREASRKLTEDALRRLRPGGLYLVQELVRRDDQQGPLFALLMRLYFEHAAVFRADEIEAIAQQAGYADVATHAIEGASINGVYVAARRPSP